MKNLKEFEKQDFMKNQIRLIKIFDEYKINLEDRIKIRELIYKIDEVLI